MGAALLLGRSSAALEAARGALTDAGWPLCEVGDGAGGAPASPASVFGALAAREPPQLVVLVPDPIGDESIAALTLERFRELEASVLVPCWEVLQLAAKVCLAPGSTVLLVADVAGRPGERGAFAVAAQRALRTMIAACAVEFATRETTLRVNLLEYDARRLDAGALSRALAFLASPAAGFMTGTQLSLRGAAMHVDGAAS